MPDYKIRNVEVVDVVKVRADSVQPDDVISFNGGSDWSVVTEVNVISWLPKTESGEVSEAAASPVVSIDHTRPTIIHVGDGKPPRVQTKSGSVMLGGMQLVTRQVVNNILRYAV